METVFDESWEFLLHELKGRRGTAVILGAVDSGKSTLARYLAEGLLRDGISVSLLDSDLGQSSLGLPGTISMKTFLVVEDLADFRPESMVFIGALSPSGNIRQVIDVVKRMAAGARGEVVIVDTSGLVSGEVGRALKIGKIRALGAAHVIALEREDEMEHILGILKGVQVYRPRVSRYAKRRSRAERIRYREDKFRAYFRGSGVYKFPVRDVEFVYRGKAFDICVTPLETGDTVGINRGEETLAVGIIKGAKEGVLLIKTPLKHIRGVDRIVVGNRPLTDIS